MRSERRAPNCFLFQKLHGTCAMTLQKNYIKKSSLRGLLKYFKDFRNKKFYLEQFCYFEKTQNTETLDIMAGTTRLVLDLLHAHRVSPKLLRNRRLNLFAIRICSLCSLHPSANPPNSLFTLLSTIFQPLKKNP